MDFARKHLPDKFFLEGAERKKLRNIITREMIENYNFTIDQFQQVMTFDSDDGMQEKWKAFKK